MIKNTNWMKAEKQENLKQVQGGHHGQKKSRLPPEKKREKKAIDRRVGLPDPRKIFHEQNARIRPRGTPIVEKEEQLMETLHTWQDKISR